MTSFPLQYLATFDNFDEENYLLANPDVANAVKGGSVTSGLSHFKSFGLREGRMLRCSPSAIADVKKSKLQDIKSLLRSDLEYTRENDCYDFLSNELRSQFDIIDTESVSSNEYDSNVISLIDDNKDGIVLDCGAGRRPIYFDNVVNFEIADYDTTDVRGVGEVLPFVDDAFDAVISIAVLEHVKDPFLCAKEIARVLKPGGQLVCSVPFLQPLHGYPHHYYNMSHQGLENLFADLLSIDQVTTQESLYPIWSLTWILQSWASGLSGHTRDDFMEMKVGDLMDNATKYLQMPFVRELSMEKNLELASGTVLFAHKEN